MLQFWGTAADKVCTLRYTQVHSGYAIAQLDDGCLVLSLACLLPFTLLLLLLAFLLFNFELSSPAVLSGPHSQPTRPHCQPLGVKIMSRAQLVSLLRLDRRTDGHCCLVPAHCA